MAAADQTRQRQDHDQHPPGDRLTPRQKKDFAQLSGGATFPWSGTLAEALFLSDGRRSIGQIHRRIAVGGGFSLEKLLGAFRAMRKYGYVRLTRPR